jgi:glucose/arabinose dehydrogenase
VRSALSLRFTRLAAFSCVLFTLLLCAVSLNAPRAALAADLAVQPFASGLDQPVGVVHAGDGSGRLFIVEQTGDIEVFSAAGTHLGKFIDLTSLISTGFERGLLGLAFHPDYETNGYLFVFYTNAAGDLRIARYTVSADPNVADETTAQTILTIPHPGYANHNGGQLNFGPDGYLYIATGDGGGSGDPDGNGQDEDQLLGKILRIDVDSASPYASPPTNPLFGPTPGRDEIWATGLRNPWRVTFDRLTGDLFIADVGQGSWEEVNVQPAGSTSLVNYGWNIMEGTVCYPPGTPTCDMTGLTPPAITYSHSLGCSITGGYRYRGAFPFFGGKYFYGDYCSGRIWAATQTGPSWSPVELLDTTLSISSFGEDEAGELYVADVSGGVVYRLLDNTDTDGDGLVAYQDNCPGTSNPTQTNSDPDVRPNGPMIDGDDATWPRGDALGDACDADDDNDGRTDADEASGAGCGGIVTSPLLADHDGDHLIDGWECDNGSNPTDPASKFLGSGNADGDADRVPDLWEQRGYDALGSSTDSDGDYCHDLVEFASVDDNSAVTDADRLAVARRALNIWAPEPVQNYALDIDKNGAVGDPDRLFVARAALLAAWQPKLCQ